MIDTRQLEYILAIAEEKNLSRAAERLFLSQSALSQQLAKLKDDGLPPLFLRQKGEMVLTDAGKVYINGARTILKINRDVEEALKNLSAAKVHQLRLGVCRLFLPLYYQQILPWLKHTYPDVEISMIIPKVGQVRHWIESAELDLVLLASEENFHEILNYIPLQQEELVWTARPELLDTPLPLSLPARDTHLRQLCDHVISRFQLSCALYAEPENITASIDLAGLGECAALLPKSCLAGTELACKSLPTPFLYYNNAVTRCGVLPPMLAEICEWLQELFSSESTFIRN